MRDDELIQHEKDEATVAFVIWCVIVPLGALALLGRVIWITLRSLGIIP